MRGYRFLGVSNVISTLPKSFSHSAIHVSLCLHSDNVTGERIISVYNCRLRSVESITVRTRPGDPNSAESTCGNVSIEKDSTLSPAWEVQRTLHGPLHRLRRQRSHRSCRIASHVSAPNSSRCSLT